MRKWHFWPQFRALTEMVEMLKRNARFYFRLKYYSSNRNSWIFKVPENRHQRRQNATAPEQAVVVSPPRKNVSKEEGSDKYHNLFAVSHHRHFGGYVKTHIHSHIPSKPYVNSASGLKIIQSYFNGQTRTDDPIDFPPLGNTTQETSSQEWNLASQMKNMVNSRWPDPSYNVY